MGHNTISAVATHVGTDAATNVIFNVGRLSDKNKIRFETNAVSSVVNIYWFAIGM